MSVIIAKNVLLMELDTALASLNGGAVILHSDILRIGFIDKLKSREEICADYLQVLTEVFAGRPLLIPSFNYDYCRSGKYDRRNSPSQVGALTDYCRARYWHLRTLTPVFNFVVFNGDDFPMGPTANPFAEESSFGQLLRRNGLILFLGARLEANTFLHYVEECHQVGYRYLKKFPGEIIDGDSRQQFLLEFRVRPLIENSAEYDWPRLTADLSREGLLLEFKVGNGTLLAHRSGDLYQFWSLRLQQDEFYFLTENSRRVAARLYREHGRPLTVECEEQWCSRLNK